MREGRKAVFSACICSALFPASSFACDWSVTLEQVPKENFSKVFVPTDKIIEVPLPNVMGSSTCLIYPVWPQNIEAKNTRLSVACVLGKELEQHVNVVAHSFNEAPALAKIDISAVPLSKEGSPRAYTIAVECK